MKRVEEDSIKLHEEQALEHKIRGSLAPIPASIFAATGATIDGAQIPLGELIPRLANVPDSVPYGKIIGFGVALGFLIDSYLHFRAADKMKKLVNTLKEYYNSKTYEHMAKADEKRMKRRRTQILEEKVLDNPREAGIGDGVRVYMNDGIAPELSYETE